MKKTVRGVELEIYGNSLGLSDEQQAGCKLAVDRLIKFKVTLAIIKVLLAECIVYLIYKWLIL